MASIVVKSPIRRNASPGSPADEDESNVSKTAKKPELETALSLHLGKCSTLSKTDHQILALIQNMPRKKPTYTDLENFLLYQPALKVYRAVTSKSPPSEEDEEVHLPDKSIRRKVYQLVFDTLYRKYIDSFAWPAPEPAVREFIAIATIVIMLQEYSRLENS